jgi:hypothetical protein
LLRAATADAISCVRLHGLDRREPAQLPPVLARTSTGGKDIRKWRRQGQANLDIELVVDLMKTAATSTSP